MSAVTFDAEKHQYSRGLQTLSAVTTVIRSVWPLKPSWDGVDMAVIENARDRGIVVDELLTGWLNGTLSAIPAETRMDAVERFQALTSWWPYGAAQAQVILTDDEIAGQADIVLPAAIYDLKNTAQIESTYGLQLGGYAELFEKQHGYLPDELGVIHVTQPKDKPVSIKVVKFEVATAVSEWRILRQFWTMARRKGGLAK